MSASMLRTATAHGAFFGIAPVFAAELVDPARKGRAFATLFAGMTAVTVPRAALRRTKAAGGSRGQQGQIGRQHHHHA